MANAPFTYYPGFGGSDLASLAGYGANPLALTNSDAFGMPIVAPSAPFAPSNPVPDAGTYAAVGVPTLGAQALGMAPLDMGDAAPANLWGSFSNWFQDSGFLGKTLPDGTKMQGWGGTALGALQGLGNAWMGAQQLKLAKQTLAENKRQFEMNFDAQRRTTNASLEDRQRARIASNPGAYQSVGDYMTKYGVR